jgi:para-aminobenzoate synthetase component 1
MTSITEAIEKMNDCGRRQQPFLFIIDFDLRKPLVWTWEEAFREDVWFRFPGFASMDPVFQEPGEWKAGGKHADLGHKKPYVIPAAYPKEVYAIQFERVLAEIKRGNSFLVNLTCQTPVQSTLSLKELYRVANSKYKLRVGDYFSCFSPETFVRIHHGKITSCPMKGTIDATIPMARQRILDDMKEKAEHSTIVDLIRNDLSRVATDVCVERFRYLDELTTDRGNLLQVSSSISGKLPENYAESIGDILVALLPAGSVTGAPKKKTVHIIRNVENYERGYYTGIFGIFDGRNLDSAVMIRFFEQTPQGMVYKSGGGITALSIMEDEYVEMVKKIYVPVH